MPRAIDHSNQEYGTAVVLEKLTQSPTTWKVWRRCCDTEVVMTMRQVKGLAKTFPERCEACRMRQAQAGPHYHLPRIARRREKRKHEQSTARRA
jgi:hypothetical protein